MFRNQFEFDYFTFGILHFGHLHLYLVITVDCLVVYQPGLSLILWYLFGIKISWCNQIVLVVPSSHTSSVKAGQFNQFGEKDVHSRRIGQSW